MHTPTPWKIGKHGSIVTDKPDRQVEITGDGAKETIEFYGGHVICETVTQDNAAFIVEACNSAAQLQAERDALQAGNEVKQAMYDGMKSACDALSAELATVKAERDELKRQIRDNNKRMITGQAYIVHLGGNQ